MQAIEPLTFNEILLDIEKFNPYHQDGRFSVAENNYIEDPEDTQQFDILKTDDDKRLVFGWANIAIKADGTQLEDLQRDIIDPDDLEEAVYNYVLNFRDGGEEHIPNMRKKAVLVESVMFTKEKMKAMGIPEGILPEGWWIGFYVKDDDAWRRVKDGTYKMFSIEGKAIREEVEDEIEKSEASGCGVIVVRDGKILTGTRIERNQRGTICGPGGHIEAGETPEEAAVREAREEFGIECKNLTPLGEQDGGRRGTSAIFLCTEFTGEPETDEKEMTDARWRTPSELEDEDLFPPFAQSLELLADSIEKAKIQKFNGYHDERGRFASKNGGGAGTVNFAGSSFKKTRGEDFEVTENVKDMYLTASAREKVNTALEKVKTAQDLQDYLKEKGIDMEIESEALRGRKDEEIPAVQKQISYVVAAVEQYEEMGGLNSVKKVHFFDSNLEEQGQYVYTARGETPPADNGHIYLSNRADGYHIMHEFAHAWADSTKPAGEDVVSWSAKLNEQAGLSKEAGAYTGASRKVMEAERFATAVGYAITGGSGDQPKREFMGRVANIVTAEKNLAKSFLDILKFNDYHDPATGRFASKGGSAPIASRTKPSVMSAEDFDNYVQKNGLKTVYRGYSAGSKEDEDSYFNAMKEGTAPTSGDKKSAVGRGLYFSDTEEEANGYRFRRQHEQGEEHGKTITAALDVGAKVADYNELSRKRSDEIFGCLDKAFEAKDRGDMGEYKKQKDRYYELNDMDVTDYAISNKYDAMFEPGSKYTVVINQKALVYRDDSIKKSASHFADIVRKFNPFHDARGRFASSSSFASYSANPKSKAGAMAISRSAQAGHGATMNVHRESQGENIRQNYAWMQGGPGAKQLSAQGQLASQQPKAPPKPTKNYDKLGYADYDDADYHQLYNGRQYYAQQKLTPKQQKAVDNYLESHPESGSLYSHSQNLNYRMTQGNTLTGKYKETHDGLMSSMHNLGHNVELTRYDHDGFVNSMLQSLGAGRSYENMTNASLKKALVGQTINEDKFLSTSYNNFSKAPMSSRQVFDTRAVKITYKAKADVQGMMPGKGPGGDLGEIILAPTNGTANRAGKIVDVKLTNQMVRRKGTQSYNQRRIELVIEL